MENGIPSQSDNTPQNHGFQNNAFFSDPSHDLFLHPSDNPNNILVCELLNGKNYGTWKKFVEIALIVKNKLGLVLGTYTRPDATSPLFNQWDRCDKMVISWLLHAAEKRISDSILFSSSSRQIWLDLEQRFGQSDGTRFFQVKKNLYSISQGNHDIAAYFTWIHLMSSKSNAFPILQSFIIFVKNQFNVSVRIIRSDTGMEFQDNTALLFYAEHGIIHQKSCVETPQQNGIVERKHKHLLEVARALMLQANLPQHFWGDSVLTAKYLINRFPTPVLD